MTVYVHFENLQTAKKSSKFLISVGINCSTVPLGIIRETFKILDFRFIFEVNLVKWLYLESFQRQQYYNSKLNTYIFLSVHMCLIFNILICFHWFLSVVICFIRVVNLWFRMWTSVEHWLISFIRALSSSFRVYATRLLLSLWSLFWLGNSLFCILGSRGLVLTCFTSDCSCSFFEEFFRLLLRCMMSSCVWELHICTLKQSRKSDS